MQQQALGLPLDPLLPTPSTARPNREVSEEAQRSEESCEELFEELAHCLHTLGEQEPAIFGKLAQNTHQPDRLQESEHSRSFLWRSLPQANATEDPSAHSPDRWILRVIYDRLVLINKAEQPHTAEILDWKTYAQPQDLRWIRQSWQTRLYLFVLAETSAYPPENISMTYWFVRHYNDRGVLTPQSCPIPYDRYAHEQTRTDLNRWIEHLTQWHRAYDTGTPFPMLPESSPQCHTCPFNQRCERSLSSFQVNYNHAINAINP